MRYLIQIGITRATIENSTNAVLEARTMARTFSAASGVGSIAYLYQETARGRWRGFEAYQGGKRLLLARTSYPPCESL